jgi:transposase
MASYPDDLPNDIEQLKQLVLAQRAEVEHLKLVIAKLKRLQFGRRSEKLDREISQLELRLEELQTTAAARALPAQSSEPQPQAPVRRPLPAHLPRGRKSCISHRDVARTAVVRLVESARTSPRCSTTCRRAFG